MVKVVMMSKVRRKTLRSIVSLWGYKLFELRWICVRVNTTGFLIGILRICKHTN
jgi:hypothetical protein